MAFNPLEEKGTPIEKQIHSWSELAIEPYNKRDVHPYTRTRIILMNGIEVGAALFGHQWLRNETDIERRQQAAMVRRIEQQQQKIVNWLIPANEHVVETTLGYEQLAVDLTAHLAESEKDPYVKQVLDFGLLEDFDHLYRYSNLLEMALNQSPETVVGNYTEIMPGRPTAMEHRYPMDDVRKPCDCRKADPLTALNVMTIVAAEQQTMNYYMNNGNQPFDSTGRALYQEIAMIEEQHVSQYGSLMDPSLSWLEKELWHEYHECWLYYSLMQEEPDSRIKKIWEEHLSQEIEHLHMAAKLLQQVEKKDAQELLPKELPPLLSLHSNFDYVRNLIASQETFNAMGTEIVPASKIPKDYRYFQYQKLVNAGDIPSEKVVDRHIEKYGKDYRLEIKGKRPIATRQ